MAQSEGARDVYRALPDSDFAETEKLNDTDASDGAAEKLLDKEEARIVSLDMADAKYKAGDQVNGEAKIEIDSNGRTFTGLTKEELLKYQNDPFWVRLRWTMFVLFWALWLLMLGAAVAIIVKSPKCNTLKWYQSPLLDTGAESFQWIEERLPAIENSGIKGVVVSAALIGDIYDETKDLKPFMEFAAKAKTHTIKVIVEMVANYIPRTHAWVGKSEQSEGEYKDYLMWTQNSELPAGADAADWFFSETRQAYYQHPQTADRASLNFRNKHVVEQFTSAMKRWLEAGASGIRLQHAADLLVDKRLKNEEEGAAPSDLRELLAIWKSVVEVPGSDTVFTISGKVPAKEALIMSDKPLLSLSPAALLSAQDTPEQLESRLSDLLQQWSAIEVSGSGADARALTAFTLLLPATPILKWEQVFNTANEVDSKVSQMMLIRQKQEFVDSKYKVQTFANKQLIALTGWTDGTGYLAVYNPSGADVSGDLMQLDRVPDTLTALKVGNIIESVQSNGLVFSPKSTEAFQFVPVVEK